MNKQATVRDQPATAQMAARARFTQSADWVGRVFGNFIYCIDACDKNLHIYNTSEAKWSSFTFAQCQIPTQ